MEYTIADSVVNLLADEYINHLSSFNHLFNGTHEILTYLKPKYSLHIITNGFQEIQEKKLKNAGISHYFNTVINSEMAGVKKPNPLIFKLSLKKTGVLAENAVMIGDNIEADILGSQAVGFKAIHFNTHNEPYHNFCGMIHELREIRNFL